MHVHLISCSQPLLHSAAQPYACPLLAARLKLASTNNGRRGVLVLDATTAGAARLNALHNGHGRGVARRDLAEDDVAAVEPRGDDGGDLDRCVEPSVCASEAFDLAG